MFGFWSSYMGIEGGGSALSIDSLVCVTITVGAYGITAEATC